MRRFIYIFILGCLPALLPAKSIKANFIVKAERENLYRLKLTKDHKYYYTVWSAMADEVFTIDSGSYALSKRKLTFHSLTKEKYFDQAVYYLGKCRKNGKEHLQLIHEDKKFLRRKVRVLTKTII